jgi:hypothetical protein
MIGFKFTRPHYHHPPALIATEIPVPHHLHCAKHHDTGRDPESGGQAGKTAGLAIPCHGMAWRAVIVAIWKAGALAGPLEHARQVKRAIPMFR